jgi:hypothetical protein
MSEKLWGATPGQWSSFAALGLTADLLPVVSVPGAKIAEGSTLKGLGKTPSLYNANGEVVGIAKWTSKETTEADVARWSAEDHYGICLQTRRVRALDIDVPDRVQAQRIATYVVAFLEHSLPLRHRDNSGKCLLAFRVGGELPKRTLKVDGGMIEFLGNGQQFIAAGTHPSGARYEWSFGFVIPGGSHDFPEIDPQTFEALWYALELEFGTDGATVGSIRKKADHTQQIVTDDVVKFLEESGHVLEYGPEGQAHVLCPFSGTHTTESAVSSTSYFPAGSRGYDRGHFVCLHAHCADRGDDQFLDAFGYRVAGFDIVEASAEETSVEPSAGAGTPASVEPPDYQRDKYGQPKALLNNLYQALKRPDICGATPCYDVFRDEILFFSNDRKKWRRASDAYYVQLRRRLETLHKFLPIGRELIRDAVMDVAEMNKVDTAIEWLNSLKWDGVPRIGNFLAEYFSTDDTAYTRAVSEYIWTALAGRVLEPGCKADMVPIFKSEEGKLKSTSIAALAPSRDEFVELDFGEKDADLARRMRGKLVAEVPELRGLRTREVEYIKAFVARTHEEWVPKFREYTIAFPRRSLFFGTTNEDHFLPEEGKKRRWLPTEVRGPVDLKAVKRDRNQLWAEGAYYFGLVGIIWEPAERLARAEHDKFVLRDGLVDVIAQWLDREDELDGSSPRTRKFLQVHEVMREALNVEVRNEPKGMQMKVSNALKQLGYERDRVFDNETSKQIRAWVPVRRVANDE